MNTLQFKVHTLKILLSFFNRLASRNSSLFVWDRCSFGYTLLPRNIARLRISAFFLSGDSSCTIAGCVPSFHFGRSCIAVISRSFSGTFSLLLAKSTKFFRMMADLLMSSLSSVHRSAGAVVDVRERVLCFFILGDVACAKLCRSRPVTRMFLFLEYCSSSLAFVSKVYMCSSLSFNAFNSSVIDFSFFSLHVFTSSKVLHMKFSEDVISAMSCFISPGGLVCRRFARIVVVGLH